MHLTKNIFLIVLIALSVFVTECKTTKTLSEKTTKTFELTDQQEAKFAFYFVNACSARMKSDVEVAENLFKECLKINPTSVAVKYELGNIYRFNGMYDNALNYAKDCANQDPKNEWYQLLLIECLHNKRLFSQSADAYNKLIKNYPNRPDFYEGLAAEYMYAGSYEKSFKTYDELEKKFGENETFTLNKVKLLKQLKKTNEAEIELKKLIATNPNDARYYTYLAEFYQENNQNTKALDTYNDVLKREPNNPMVHLALAEYYKSQNDKEGFFKEIKIAFQNPDLDTDTKLKVLISYYQLTQTSTEYLPQAYELCEVVNTTHPTSAEAHSIYADFLYRDKKTKEAKVEYELAVKYDKSSFSTWNQLLFCEAELNNYQSLEVKSSEAMELFPNQASVFYFNGLANIQLKNYTKAVQSLNDGVEFVYNNNQLLLEFYSNLGDAYNALKEYEKSDKAYENGLKVDPDNSLILNNYSYYLSLRKQNLEKAEKFSKRSNELTPNNRSYIDTYGWILYQLGKYKEAEEWLARAVKMGNKSAIAEHYGDVLFKLNKKDEALQYWKEAKVAGGGSNFLDKKIADKKLYD